MKSKHFHHLIVFVQTSLVFARTYPNYGYYNPFPPKNQVLYNFSPLPHTTSENNIYNDESSSLTNNEVYGRRKGGNSSRNRYNSYITVKDNSDRKHKNSRFGKGRETRDLTWRKFDVFLRGDAEPSCAELRQMWNLARKLQKQASKENSPFSTKVGKNIHLKKHGKNASDSDNKNSVTTTDKKLAPTAEDVEIITNRKNNSDIVQSSDDRTPTNVISPSSGKHTSKHIRELNDANESSSSSTTEEVFGVLKTHHVPKTTPPTPAKSIPSPTTRYNTFRVRDPAKEIFGIFRQRSKGLRDRQRKPQKQRNRNYHIGKVHFKPPTYKDKSTSYLELLQSKLYGVKLPNEVDGDRSSDNEVYGVVNHYSPASSHPSAYEKAREMVANHRGSLGFSDEALQLDSGESAFDRIREELMKTRAKDKLNMPKSYLRRLRSKKRRQNVSSKI